MPNNHNFKDTQTQFAAHIRNPQLHPKPDGIDENRMDVYRKLFFNSISGLLEQTFPVLSAVITDQKWQHLIRDFYQKQHNKTPYFTEIPGEFMRYVQDQKIIDDCPFMAELAHYEWLELSVEKDNHELTFQSGLSGHALLTGQPVVSPWLRLHSYHYPVHQISRQFQPTEASEQPHYHVVWRNQEEAVRFATLSTFTAALLSLLLSEQVLTGQRALQQLYQQSSGLDKSMFMQSGQQQLEKWYHQNIITGLL